MYNLLRAGLLFALLLGLWTILMAPFAGTHAAAPPAADCPATGHVITGPTLNRDPTWAASMLRAVAAAGPGDVWAVGQMTTLPPNAQLYKGAVLIEHWTGTTWQRVPGPDAGAGTLFPHLNALAVISPRNIWAVGGAVGDSGPTAPAVPLIIHWDGSAWARVAPPSAAAGTELTVVAAGGPEDVWVGGAGTGGAHVFHWDGRAWQETPMPVPVGLSATWSALVVPAPGDAWIAGNLYDATVGGGRGALLAHWDGHTWTAQAAGLLPPSVRLTALAASGPRDVWTAGNVDPLPGPVPTSTPGGPGDPYPPGVGYTVALHWDGAAWTRVPMPDKYYIEALAAPQPGDAWAAGLHETEGGKLGLLHWDGTAWTPAPISGRDGELYYDGLTGLAAEAPGDLWAVGFGHITGPQPSSYMSAVHIFSDCAVPTVPGADPHDPAVTYFPETGHTLRGLFRDYWTAHGGLAQFGYPLTEEFSERNPDDGHIYTVQYFERNRFELHPENAGTPYVVLLGLLGRGTIASRLFPDPAFAPLRSGPPGSRFFPATGHSLAPAFRAYWESHGGLPVYGYPISEPFQEWSLTDSKYYTVQYFERNRFELHPELPPDFRVSLGLLGVDLLRSRGWIR